MTHSRSRRLVSCLLLTFVALPVFAAEPSTRPIRSAPRPASTNPDYTVPYRTPRIDGISKILRAVKTRLEASVYTSVAYHAPIADSAQPADGRKFSLNTYAMGVVYSGMLNAADATGDKSFADFDASRFQLFADAIANLDLAHVEHHRADVTALLVPNSLDDCGSMGASMIKARRAGVGPDLKVAIDRIAQYICHDQLRLSDGTLARARPLRNSIWADDAYMSIPFLAQMGALTGDRQYFDDAAAQMLHFANYLFVPATGLFTHHWNTSNPDDQPHYFWGRANGWCFMTMAELLEVLPADHPMRARIMSLFRTHAAALANAQAGDGLWHQMLDRTDSYTETSCSAMFTFAFARGVNRGWLDAGAYAPVAQTAWNGLTTRIDDQGRITGTCIGTSYAADYVYYYHRPTTEDIHGYGPVLLAGSEMINLLKNPHWRSGGTERGTPAMFTDRSLPPASQPEAPQNP